VSRVAAALAGLRRKLAAPDGDHQGVEPAGPIAGLAERNEALSDAVRGVRAGTPGEPMKFPGLPPGDPRHVERPRPMVRPERARVL
jgi:hypothetical protein